MERGRDPRGGNDRLRAETSLPLQLLSPDFVVWLTDSAQDENGFVYTDTVAAAGVGRPSELDELDLAER